MQTIVLRHNNDETVVAIVTCDDNIAIKDGDDLRNAIKAAVTEWIKSTDEGKAALEESSDDFNLGDLMNELPDGDHRSWPGFAFGYTDTITPFLNKHAVFNLKVQVFPDDHPHNWQYDDHLFD